MKMIRFALLSLVAVTIAALPARAELLGFNAGVQTGKQDITGNLQYQGDNLDIKDTLGLKKENKTGFRFKLKHPLPVIPNVYYHYIPSSFSGTGSSATAVQYGGKTYQANTTLKTDVKMDRHDIGLFYGIPFLSAATMGILDAELGLNARMLQFSGSIEGTVQGTSLTEKAEKSVSAVIPQLYGYAEVVPVKYFAVTAEVKWLSAGKNSMTSTNIEAQIRPFPMFYIAFGQFSDRIKLDTSDVKTDLTVSYPYAGLGFYF